GLEEVRRYIHQMASDTEDSPLSQQLSRIIDEFALHTGTSIHLKTRGKEMDLPNHMKWTLLRCLQESLTNAKRHGQAASIQVTYICEKGKVGLVVEDNGIGIANPTYGFGLNGMKERLSALHGTLQVHSRPGQGT